MPLLVVVFVAFESDLLLFSFDEFVCSVLSSSFVELSFISTSFESGLLLIKSLKLIDSPMRLLLELAVGSISLESFACEFSFVVGFVSFSSFVSFEFSFVVDDGGA